MKRLFAACLILFLLLGASLCSSYAVGTLTQTCIQQLKEAQILAAQDNWPQARSTTHQTFEYWQSFHFPLHALMRHAENDQILVSFRSVEQYLTLEEMDQYAAANVTLITQLELLAEMEQASLENVL